MLDAETVVGSGTMKITCSREELTQKLGVVSRGVSTRTAVQILGGILLKAEAGKLLLAATDMELSLRASLEAQVDGEGAVVVPGRLLVELARLLTRSSGIPSTARRSWRRLRASDARPLATSRARS